MSRMSALLLVLMIVPGGARLQAQQPTPSRIHSRAATFDIQRNRLVLFGGYMNRQYFSELWEFDGTGWSMHSPATGPAGRNSGMLVYDAQRGVTVLFGGDNASGVLADTWEWNGQSWRERTGSTPPPRTIHAMAYDAERGRIVVFGGQSVDSAGVRYLPADTWEWDGERWHRVAMTGPVPRLLHGMAYDAKRRRTVMYGGAVLGPDNRPSASLDDTWEWDGTTWQRIDVAGPSARDHAVMTYDEARGVIVLHGGAQRGTGAVGDTWEYDGASWVRVSTEGPARAAHRLVYDPASASVLLFGGWSPAGPSSELWRYHGRGWTRIGPADQ